MLRHGSVPLLGSDCLGGELTQLRLLGHLCAAAVV